MRLVNYGAGEIADRLTILALKILHGDAGGKETKHFRDERNALLPKLQARGSSVGWLEELIELGAVNSTIWHAEEDLRRIREEARMTQQVPGSSYSALMLGAGEIAFRLQTMNDRRAGLIEAINKDVGEHLGEEKL